MWAPYFTLHVVEGGQKLDFFRLCQWLDYGITSPMEYGSMPQRNCEWHFWHSEKMLHCSMIFVFSRVTAPNKRDTFHSDTRLIYHLEVFCCSKAAAFIYTFASLLSSRCWKAPLFIQIFKLGLLCAWHGSELSLLDRNSIFSTLKIAWIKFTGRNF